MVKNGQPGKIVKNQSTSTTTIVLLFAEQNSFSAKISVLVFFGRLLIVELVFTNCLILSLFHSKNVKTVDCPNFELFSHF